MFQFQFHIVIKNGLEGPIAFHKKHFKKSWIISINTFNPTKRIVLQRWEHNIQMNEDFPRRRIDPPHEGHQRTTKKWHYTSH